MFAIFYQNIHAVQGFQEFSLICPQTDHVAETHLFCFSYKE